MHQLSRCRPVRMTRTTENHSCIEKISRRLQESLLRCDRENGLNDSRRKSVSSSHSRLLGRRDIIQITACPATTHGSTSQLECPVPNSTQARRTGSAIIGTLIISKDPEL